MAPIKQHNNCNKLYLNYNCIKQQNIKIYSVACKKK